MLGVATKSRTCRNAEISSHKGLGVRGDRGKGEWRELWLAFSNSISLQTAATNPAVTVVDLGLDSGGRASRQIYETLESLARHS